MAPAMWIGAGALGLASVAAFMIPRKKKTADVRELKPQPTAQLAEAA